MKPFILMLLSISSPENDTLRDRIAARIAFVDGIMAVAFHDLMLMFKALAEGSIASAHGCEAMIDILDDQKFRDLIPSQLPLNVRVAHKTGSISGVEHDSGIVFLPDGRRYVLVILSKNLNDRDQGKKAIADISRMFYDHVTGH